MRITQLNHVALHVADVERSLSFYRDVLGLALMPRPAFGFPGAWLMVGEGEHHQEVHLIGRPPENDTPPRERHVAFRVDDLPAFAARLAERGIACRGPKPRPDGAWQLFLSDPDGHVIELCTSPASPTTP